MINEIWSANRRPMKRKEAYKNIMVLNEVTWVEPKKYVSTTNEARKAMDNDSAIPEVIDS